MSKQKQQQQQQQQNTFAIGQIFVRNSDKAQGELTADNKIRFQHPVSLTFHIAPFNLDKWQAAKMDDLQADKKADSSANTNQAVKTSDKAPKAPKTPIQAPTIDELAENFDAKQNEVPKDDLQADKTENSKTDKAKGKKKDDTVFEDLTDEEKALRKKLEKQFLTLKKETDKAEVAVVKNPFKLAKIIAEIRAKRLYKNTHKTMELYAIEVLKIERQNALAYASIGEYAKIAEFYLEREKIDVSFKASNRLVVNQNALRDALKMPKQTPLSDFEGLLSEVVEITGKVARNDDTSKADNVSLTPRIIDETAKVIQGEITSGLSGQTFAVTDAIAKATAILQSRKPQIVSKAKVALQVAPKAPLPKCESHSDIATMKVKSFANGILTLECGCTFKQFTV